MVMPLALPLSVTSIVIKLTTSGSIQVSKSNRLRSNPRTYAYVPLLGTTVKYNTSIVIVSYTIVTMRWRVDCCVVVVCPLPPEEAPPPAVTHAFLPGKNSRNCR